MTLFDIIICNIDLENYDETELLDTAANLLNLAVAKLEEKENIENE